MEKIEKREITTELKESYLDYAMSVIVSRALPDVRDGLKPVQRRILWAMWDMGLTHAAKFIKSARVTGDCMGKYHPHGDVAIYDALARMAQDFSLRYPLIQGQGNFGCFTKDTKVKLTDGRNLNFEELIKGQQRGEKYFGFTFNIQTKKIEIAEIKNPRLTRKNEKIMEVVLDNKEKIRCTLDHLFMLRNGEYRKAKELKPNDSLMPAYFNIRRIRSHYNYLGVLQPFTGRYEFVHRLADEYNARNGKVKKNLNAYVLHHKDFNKFNNSPENIKRLTIKQHYKIHLNQSKNLWKAQGDKFREKHRKSLKKIFSNPLIRKKISERSKKLWKNPVYRAKFPLNHASKMARKLWENPAMKEMHRTKMLRQRQNPEFIKKNKKGLQKFYECRIKENPNLMRELAKKSAISLRKNWKNPDYKAKVIKSKILGYAYFLLNKYQKLTPAIYEDEKTNNCIPRIENALKYFNNLQEIEEKAKLYNHKVISTKILHKKEDVYDLTIERTHNFCLATGIFVHNSIDNDPPASQRYTECRLSKISEELLFDIEKETVDFGPNYDSSRTEPKVLPAKLPNLLLNGISGIAVGMATNIPPHNLNEIINAINCLIDNPKATIKELMEFINGPDFPTGGLIYNKKAIVDAYNTGRGAITTRAKTEIQERAKNQFNIVISEIPYQVNKSELIIKMAELAQNKKIEGIRDIRDESDREGMRIVIELKSDASAQKILNQLFKHTDLQKNFNLNMIALIGGLQPQLMTLKDILSAYIDHRKEVVRRRAEFDLKKAKERTHILEGLLKALSAIDKIIETIKKSKDAEEAHQKLIKNFKLTDIQATAILEMKLRTLAALERLKLENELKEKKKLIAELEAILKSPQKILKVIKDELAELKNKYNSERRTKLVAGGLEEFTEEDLVPQEEVVITLTSSGYIKRLPPSNFKTQRRGGKGLIGQELGDEDFVSHFISANTHDNILFFTDKGRVFQTKVYEIPVGSRTAKGKLIQNFLDIPAEENVSAIISYATNDKQLITNNYLVMLTKNGVIKKTTLEDFTNIRRTGIIAINLTKGDSLNWVRLSSGSDEIILATANGQAIRFKEKQLRPMGRTAAGVKAIKLKKDDFISGIDIITDSKAQFANRKLLIVTENGFAKQTALKEYKVQSRGGSGIKTAKINSKTGKIIAAQIITDEEELLALSSKGQIIKTDIKSVRTAGRATSGVRIMRLKENDKIVGIVIL